MARDKSTRFITLPFTRTAGNVPGELTILADNGAPAVVGDCNVTLATAHDRAPQRISIMGRVSGAAEAAAVITLKWYVYHWKTAQFYQAAHMQVVGSSGFTNTQGNILVVQHNPQCQLGYVEATGIVANQDLHVVIDEVIS